MVGLVLCFWVWTFLNIQKSERSDGFLYFVSQASTKVDIHYLSQFHRVSSILGNLYQAYHTLIQYFIKLWPRQI